MAEKTNSSVSPRIGLLGGSFDPIHNGHMAIAQGAKEKFDLQKIIFVPAYCPPHKSRPDLAPFEHRFNMIRAAIEDIPYFEISGIEGKESCPSYAGTTVEELKAFYGKDCCFYFIIGLDALLTITDWEKSRTYPGLCYFIATTRPGFTISSIKKEIPREFHPYIIINEMPAFSISSSDIKYRIRSNLPIDGMVPDRVKAYIEKFKIYTMCFT